MPQTILVVDDDLDILETTKDFLQKRGFEILTATNGLDALNKLKQKIPDLILADVLMPEMDGYAFYKELKKNIITSNIPVLIITGRGKMEESFKVLGVDGFITKPFTTDNLLSEIEHIFNLAEHKIQTTSRTNHQIANKVLAVGSHKAILEDISFQSKRAGYVIEIALSGADAIAKAIRFSPKIIFVELLIQDLSISELISIIRRIPQFEQIPIIGYSYYDINDLGRTDVRQEILKYNELGKRILQQGATAYIGRYNHQLYIKTLFSFLNKNA